MARRELGVRGRLAALGGALALLLALAVVLGGGADDDFGPLRAADLVDALDDAGIEAVPTGRSDVCASIPSERLVEYRTDTRGFWVWEWRSVEGTRNLVWRGREQGQGHTIRSCTPDTSTDLVFWHANLALTASSVPEDISTQFEPAADPDLARIVEVFLALEPPR